MSPAATHSGSIAVIIPVLNEAEALPRVLASIPAWVGHVIVADNGSSDGSGEIARRAGAVVVEEPRRGYGSACLKALGALPDDVGIVVFVDGDASDDTAEMTALVEPIVRGEADLVLGSRVLGEREEGALTPQQEDAIESLTRGIINKIAHGPISELRRRAGDPEGVHVVDAIRRVFHLK